MIPDTNGQHSTWQIVDFITTTLSIGGSLFMGYFCMIFLRYNRSVQVRMILSIAIADFIFSISNVLTNFEKNETVGLLCKSEAIIRQTGYIMTIYFTVVAAMFASKVTKLQTEESKNRFFYRSVGYGFLICVLTLLGPIVAGRRIGISEGPLYCQISYTSEDNLFVKYLILMLYEGLPMLTGTILTLQAYLHVIREIKALPESFVSQLNINVYSLLWYPAVLFGSFLPCLFDSLYRLSRPANEPVPSWILAMHILLPHSIGFTNAIVYGVQRKLYSNSFAKDEDTVTATLDISEEEDYEVEDQELARELLRAERLSSKKF